MKRFVLGIIATAAITSVQAFAADMPVKARSVAVDPAGNILLHGAIFTMDELVPTVSKLDPSGKTIWDTQISTLGKLTNDSEGNVYISGADVSGPSLSVSKLDSVGKLLFTFNPQIKQLQSVTNVTSSIVDPFGNLLATGFGPSSAQIGLDAIVTLKLSKDFKPASAH